MDTARLLRYGAHPRELRSLVPLSGHTITHFAERAARGMPATQALVDSLAPLYHVRRQSLPVLLITGDRDLELYGRYEETAYFWRMMQLAGNSATELYELEGYGHQMVGPALPLLLRHVAHLSKSATPELQRR